MGLAHIVGGLRGGSLGVGFLGVGSLGVGGGGGDLWSGVVQLLTGHGIPGIPVAARRLADL